MMSSVHTEQYLHFLGRLKEARHEAGLTQVKVAEAMGKHQSFIAKSESGERRVDVIELISFSTIYQKDLEYFIDFPS
jgi:transcriptional regulator with XRE-family HTH domain